MGKSLKTQLNMKERRTLNSLEVRSSFSHSTQIFWSPGKCNDFIGQNIMMRERPTPHWLPSEVISSQM